MCFPNFCHKNQQQLYEKFLFFIFLTVSSKESHFVYMLTNTALLFASSATQPRRPLQLINESSQPHFDPIAPQQKSSKILPLIQGNDMYTAIKSMQKELQVISRKVDILLSKWSNEDVATKFSSCH